MTIDRILQTYITHVNENTAPIKITIIVGGTIITGTAVSAGTYLAQQGLANVPGQTEEDTETLLKTAAANEFIHLIQATVLTTSGNGIRLQQDDAWRIPLSSVDGFSLGHLTL